ncbi:YceG family protein [Clostridium ganghwense]|uniref:Putative component of 'biosynthetic module' domain-containing protein n=1 Tax=Clostridium ganghwense TaxID=312089 RepID=A0ABT4CM22_9CLOT|nr:YceG family protein [Clostridium ganghwense]MCY6370102.1 hypothetical protein [Clostridium ganghwense]
MVNIRKFINSSLQNSNNIFNDILIPLNKRTGFMNGPSPILPVYFYRCMGIKENEEEYYDELYKLEEKLSKLNNLYLKFISNIPFKNNSKLVEKIQMAWSRNSLEPFDNTKIETLIKILKGNGSISNIDSALLNSSIEESFHQILELYLKKEPNLNLTKVKNFTLKLITWINDFIPSLIQNFNLKVSSNSEIINPKVIYYGDIKKHEVYFLIFLSRLGCDVLYINSPSDCDFSLIDKEGHYSKILNLPKKINLNIPQPQIKTSVKTFNVSNYMNSISSSLKTSNDIFKDFSCSLNKRSGFIGKPMPIIPVYFYRYIGIKEKQDEYYNDLYKLDKKLESLGDLYLKITNDLHIDINTELINKTNNVWKAIPNFNKNEKDILLSLLVEAEAFPDLREEIINSSIIKSFSSILEIYLNTQSIINTAKIKNFSLKILMWIYKFIPNLFKKFDYLKNSTGEIYSPKILYYGDIKKHEAYFLLFLSKIGCDVLYINSYNDQVFDAIDKNQVHSKLITLPNTLPLKEFPLEEIIIRQETTAFKASSEISNVIYNEEDGLYKPWQFEQYKTHPLTLKTTYDELKILWKEEARMRPDFKIENGTVYLPNLFAKISGVHNDLNMYWREFAELKEAENLLFIPQIPYTKVTYSRYDLYSLEYCFDKNGLVDKESLFKNQLYKFSYLKTSLQNTIIDKINQLLKLSFFKDSLNTEFRLKILMTILTMDKKILELIQKFDYPFKIPKILVYDNNESIFSDEDFILLAFLNLIGFDIVIFTPTGYNNIEQKIYEKYFDTHKLEDIKFNLEIPNLNSIHKNKSDSFWSKLFK